MNKSESIVKLAGALCEVQKTELFALTSKKNPFFKSKYADLSSVWDAIRAPLTSNGLAITQTMESNNMDGVTIETTLMHASGEYISGSLYIKPEKNTPQGLGSAITYGRRYALMAIIGVSPEDDDGEHAMERKREYKKEAHNKNNDKSDIPNAAIKKPDTKKKLSKAEIIKLENYIIDSAKLLDMDAKTLQHNAEMAGDLDDMLESVMKRKSGKQDVESNKGNWWDVPKHWSFREKNDLMNLILSGFGKNMDGIKVCADNPDAYNVLKVALPETKKALTKKYDKMFGDGALKELLKKGN